MIVFWGIIAAIAPHDTMPVFLPSDVNACANAAFQLNCSTIRWSLAKESLWMETLKRYIRI